MERPETRPTTAPTFQISRADHYAVTLVAINADRANIGELPPLDALEAVSSLLLQPAPDNGIEFCPSAIGLHRQVIAEGYAGTEADQPDTVMTFLGAMVTKRFVIEVVRNQTWLDKLKRRHTILYSYAFGEPQPVLRTI
jgi:hypothetical protein